MAQGRGLGPGRIVAERRADGRTVYVGQWTDSSRKPHRKVLGTDRRVATRRLADIVRQRDLADQGMAVEGWAARPLPELRAAYLADLSARCSEGHVERQRGALERVLGAIGASTVGDIRTDALVAYRASRLQAKRRPANATVNREVAAVVAMLNWAVDLGWLQQNPVRLKRLPQGRAFQKLERRALTEEECGTFLRAAREMDAENGARALAATTIGHGTKGPGYESKDRVRRVPQAPLWRAFLETGGRFSEVVRAPWGELDETGSTLRFRAETTKGKRERTLPLSAELTAELSSLRVLHAEVLGRIPKVTDPIFLTPKGCAWVGQNRNALRMFHEVCARAGIAVREEDGTKLDIHALRVTFCTRLALAGVPIQVAQSLMGHQSVEMTANIYTRVTTQNLRDALRVVPPLEVPRERGDEGDGQLACRSNS